MRSQSISNQVNAVKTNDLLLNHEFTMNGFDKRKIERFSLELPTHVMVKNSNRRPKTLELRTRNVCSGGAFVTTDDPLSVGAEVGLRMMLSLERLQKYGGTKSVINVSGSVIRTDDKGMAICFDEKYSISPVG